MKYKGSPKFVDLKELLVFLQGCKLIGIHGPTGSGKTSLAEDLNNLIGGTRVTVDAITFEANASKKFLDQVNFAEVNHRILTGTPPIIVDCYVVLDIFDTLNLTPDTLLLCERVVENASFDIDLERDYTLYEKRYNPRASARQVFTVHH